MTAHEKALLFLRYPRGEQTRQSSPLHMSGQLCPTWHRGGERDQFATLAEEI